MHDLCPTSQYNCQNHLTSYPRHFQLEGSGIQKINIIFTGTQKAWDKNLKPAIKVAASFIGMAAAAKSKNPKVGRATTIVLKTISGGKVLSITHTHRQCNGLRFKEICFLFKEMSSIQ